MVISSVGVSAALVVGASVSVVNSFRSSTSSTFVAFEVATSVVVSSTSSNVSSSVEPSSPAAIAHLIA